MKKWLQALLFYVGFPTAGVVAWIFLIIAEAFTNGWLMTFIIPAVTILLYVLLRKYLSFRFAVKCNAVFLIVLSVCLALSLCLSAGSVRSNAFILFRFIAFPFAIPSLIMGLSDEMIPLFIAVFLTYTAAMIASMILMRLQKDDAVGSSRSIICRILPYLITFAFLLICGSFSMKLYLNRPEVRYAGHGFDYMNGYSTTDFTDYTVYSEHSKLAPLDRAPEFIIENEEDMPVMDGAEACYPVYAAVAKAVYRNIDRIETDALNEVGCLNGKIVSFTNTVDGFRRLLDRDVDLFFGARPSKNQMVSAENYNIALTVTPIGREGFVFFVEEDNPVDNLTSEQVRAIYHGDITNWKEVGGKDQKIKAFQRPKDSGSQAMMEYFMDDVTLMEPDTYEIIGGMLDVIDKVAQYANEEGAFGYSFRYFVEELSQEKGVKLLSIDGVAPTLENIENGSYPLTVDLCLTTRADDPNPYVQKMIDFMLSKDGQEIIRKTGYAGLQTEN